MSSPELAGSSGPGSPVPGEGWRQCGEGLDGQQAGLSPAGTQQGQQPPLGHLSPPCTAPAPACPQLMVLECGGESEDSGWGQQGLWQMRWV